MWKFNDEIVNFKISSNCIIFAKSRIYNNYNNQTFTIMNNPSIMGKLPFLFLALFLFSCKPTDSNVINFVDALEANETPLLSSIASEIKYIPLESNSESPIDIVTNLHINDSLIVIECHRMKFFRVFDKDGNYLRTIDRKGNGPEEYSTFFGSAFEDDGGIVSVLQRNMIKRYNSLGEYVGSIQLDQSQTRYFRELNYIGDNLYKLNSSCGDSTYIEIFDIEGKRANSTFAAKSYTQRIGEISLTLPPTITYTNDLFYVIGVGNDSIYRYDKELNSSLAYMIDFGKYDYLNQSNDINDLIQFGQSFFIELDNCLIMSLALPHKEFSHIKGDNLLKGGHMLVYDKLSGETLIPQPDPVYNISGFRNDIDKGPSFSPSYMYGNKMYMFIDAINFLEYAEKCKSEEMKKVAAKITEESNPVLVEVTLK